MFFDKTYKIIAKKKIIIFRYSTSFENFSCTRLKIHQNIELVFPSMCLKNPFTELHYWVKLIK